MNTLSSARNDSLLKRLTPFLAVVWLLLFWCLFFTSPLPNASNSERTIDRLDVLLLLPEIYESLLSPDADPATSSRWSNLAERFDVLGIALFIVISAIASGRLLLRGLGLFNSLETTDRMALVGGMGLSVVSLGTLGFGLAGLLSRPLFIVVLAAVTLIEIWCSRSSIKGIRTQRGHDLPSSGEVSRWMKIIVLAICVPFLWYMLLGSLLPPTDFDVKEYHLGGPKEYFLAGRVLFLPHDVYTSFPFLTEMLSLAAMVLRGDWERGAYAGQAVLMFFAPLTGLGAYCVAKRLAGPAAGWLAAMAYLTTPWTYRISIIAYTEGALCCYVVLALLAFQIWQEKQFTQETVGRWCWRELLVLGFLAGSAVSTKYPGMILVAIPFGAAVVISTIQLSGWNARFLFLNLLVYGIGVLAAFGPWMAKNLFETGNPVYPLLYGVFGGVDWNEAMHRKWQAAHPARLLTGSWDDFAGVFYKNDWQSPLLFGLAPLAFLGKQRRSIAAVAAYAAILLAAWYLFTHRIDRFWVPMNSVMAVLAGCGLAAVLGMSGERRAESVQEARPSEKTSKQNEPTSLSLRMAHLGVVGLVAIAIVYNLGFITTPLCGYNAYFSSYAAAQEQVQTQSVKIVNWLKLPPGSKVLFVGEAELFDAHFPYAYNTVFDQNLFEAWTATSAEPGEWRLKSAPEILSKFHEEGITHLFVNWNEILRYRTTYGFTDYVTPARIQQIVSDGILTPVPLPDSIALRPWERVDRSWQNEIEKQLPQLKIAQRGDWMLQYQCFQVNPGEPK